MEPTPPLATSPYASGGRDADVRERSIAKYARRAAGYDATCGPTWPIRLRAVEALGLQPGDRVLDVGCGTGLSLPLLVRAVGPSGHVHGFDQSAAMLEQARARSAGAGWRNVSLHECSGHELNLPMPVDALLFHYVHDILRSPPALARLLSLARPGARVAVAGIKYFPGLLGVLNPWVYLKNHGYNGAPGELRTPWDLLAPRLTHWHLTPTQWGMGYIASGRLPCPTDARPAAARAKVAIDAPGARR
jgi:demethylmenaquinone methyltransferase/2-methoxy-6-polyprenyl-1,4-benzoquinol methylase